MLKYSDMLVLSQSGTNHKKSDGSGGRGGVCGKRVGEVWLARIFSCLYENFISIIIFLVQPLVGFCGENLLHTFSILN